jgi:hypothetical protein
VSGGGVITRLTLSGGDLTVRHYQDCEDIIARNKALRGEPQRSDWGRHIATIPNNILLRWMLEEGVPVFGMPAHEWDRFLRRKLADPDWRDLRTD